MDNPPDLPATVAPLIRRHAEDAAFYWQQIDTSLDAVGLDAVRAGHFARLLEAHLEGLAVAGCTGGSLSHEALQRWLKPGEVFAAMWTALNTGDAAGQDRVLTLVARQPDLLLRGVISALAWTPVATAQPWLDAALPSDDPVRLVAALRAVALLGATLPAWAHFARHAHSAVRAAACRCAGPDDQPGLPALQADAQPAVRAESVIAWARLVPPAERPAARQQQAASTLWHSVAAQIDALAAATGWYRMQAQRRLRRWLRHLAWVAPLGHPGVPALLERLPRRAALDFALHHGDAAALPFVLRAMHEPEHARWAGWVWQTLTGQLLADAGLVLPEPPVDLDGPLTPARQDADQGLPLPDAAAAAAHPASRLRPGPSGGEPKRMLLGQPVTEAQLRAVLDPQANAVQAVRAVAAFALPQLRPDLAVNLRARPAVCASQLQQIGLAAVRIVQ